MGRAGVCEVCAIRHDDSFDFDVFHLCGVAWVGWVFSTAVSITVAVALTKRTDMHSKSNPDQWHARTERSIPGLAQTTRPRTHRQPLELSPAHPHQALPCSLRARKHAFRPSLRHRHSILASDVWLPHRLALSPLLPNLGHRRHRIRNGRRNER